MYVVCLITWFLLACQSVCHLSPLAVCTLAYLYLSTSAHTRHFVVVSCYHLPTIFLPSAYHLATIVLQSCYTKKSLSLIASQKNHDYLVSSYHSLLLSLHCFTSFLVGLSLILLLCHYILMLLYQPVSVLLPLIQLWIIFPSSSPSPNPAQSLFYLT